jgi:hypothetical protein
MRCVNKYCGEISKKFPEKREVNVVPFFLDDFTNFLTFFAHKSKIRSGRRRKMLTKSGLPVLTNTCVFALPLPTKDEPRIIYAPTASDVAKMHANRTSKHIIKNIGHDRVDFIDIIPEAPMTTPSSQILRRSLRAMVTPLRISDWCARIIQRVHEVRQVTGTTPIVYIAGELCSDAWNSGGDQFTWQRAVSAKLGVHLYKTKSDGCDVVVMEGHPHPSAAMVSGNEPLAVTADKTALCIVKALTSSHAVEITESAIISLLDSQTKMRLKRAKEFMADCKLDDAATATGWWPDNLRHWRHSAFDLSAFWLQCAMLLTIFGPCNGVLTCVMGMHVFNRLVTPDVLERFKQWYDRLGQKRFTTFMCNSVASGLAGEHAATFQERLMVWFDRLGDKRFTTFFFFL